jgi:hypothetical protein
MNRMQWLSVWGFNSSQTSLKTTIQLARALPKAAVQLAVKLPLAIFPRPLRPAV